MLCSRRERRKPHESPRPPACTQARARRPLNNGGESYDARDCLRTLIETVRTFFSTIDQALLQRLEAGEFDDALPMKKR